MSLSSSQASIPRHPTTGAVALAVATAATLATAPAFAALRPVQDPQGFIVSPALTQISFTHFLKTPEFYSYAVALISIISCGGFCF